MYKLSIIIPVYNVEQYLEQCILSIKRELKQTDELILINDGSKDNSFEICKKYECDNVTVINNTNQGVSCTRNQGIDLAKGEYIAFVDSDDYLLEGWRNVLEKGMETGADVVFFSTESDDIPSKDELIKNILFLPVKKSLPINAGACWSKLFRRNFLSDHNISFDADIINGEDGLFCLESVLECNSYAVVHSHNLYFYRTNIISASNTFNERYSSSNIKYIESVQTLLNRHDIFSADERKRFVDFIKIRGLYILAYRISLLPYSKCREKYVLFTTPEYTELFNTYTPDKKCSVMMKLTFSLLKNGKYDTAIKVIKIKTQISKIAKKILMFK